MMDKKQVVPPTIPIPSQPTLEEMTEEIKAKVTIPEKEFLDSMANLLAEFRVDEKGTTVIKDSSLTELIRTSLSVTTNFYLTVFPDSKIITRFKSKKAMKEYITFRAKYMNMSIDAQKTELRGMGIVKTKQS